MTEWKEYTGSGEQIEEMWNADGYILRFSNKVDNRIRNAKESWSASFHFYEHCREAKHVTHYLICNPHPLEDMICQQARTGQEVWVRIPVSYERYGYCYITYGATTTPDWNIPGAEYSFTEFKEEV